MGDVEVWWVGGEGTGTGNEGAWWVGVGVGWEGQFGDVSVEKQATGGMKRVGRKFHSLQSPLFW